MIVMCTVGYGDILPYTNTEKIFTVIFALFSAVLYAQIFGAVATYLQGRGQAQLNIIRDCEMIQQFGDHNNLSHTLMNQLMKYKVEIWKLNAGVNLRDLISPFPQTVQEEIMMHINRNLVLKVPMFADCDESFISRLVCILEVQVFLPNEYIVRHGQVSNGMYFIRRGQCTVKIPTIEGKDRAVSMLTTGSYFGEVTLLSNCRRTASVITSIRTEVGFLSRISFNDVIEDYPDYLEKFHETAMRRLKRDTAQTALLNIAEA
jgi:hypothetical protein